MSFAEEFKKMRTASAGAPKAEESDAPAEESSAEEQTSSESNPDQELLDSAYGDAAKTFGAAAKESSELQTEEGTPVAPKKEEPKPADKGKAVKIRIGGKEFDNEADALKYANDLELIRLQDEAAKAALESVKPKEVKVEAKKIKLIADKLFENPEEALEELEKLIEEKAEAKVKANDDAKTRAQQEKEEAQNLWDKFYSDNQDLSQHSEEVNRILEKEWAKLQHMKRDEGMAELANLTRAYIESLREKLLPKQVLPNKKIINVGSTSPNATATKTQATKQKDDFISQIRKHGKRNVVQEEA
jgi:hypothetical protein